MRSTTRSEMNQAYLIHWSAPRCYRFEKGLRVDTWVVKAKTQIKTLPLCTVSQNLTGERYVPSSYHLTQKRGHIPSYCKKWYEILRNTKYNIYILFPNILMSGITLAECGCDNNGLQVSSVNYRFLRQQILTHLETYLPESVNVEFLKKSGLRTSSQCHPLLSGVLRNKYFRSLS